MAAAASCALPKVAVVGAGTMGAGIAGVFAAAGYPVALFSRSDATLNAAKAQIIASCPEAKIDATTSVADCVRDAGIVSENVAENLDLKRMIFAEIELCAAPDALLTTNTSSVPISMIAADLQQPERLVGLHWFNPAGVMPLIEIVRGARTSDATIDGARALCMAIGKETIEIIQEVPGFVVNRLQYALLREALHLVESGVATRDDVDRAVKTTLAPRWSAMGPLRLMDLAGLDTVEKVAAILMPALCNSTVVPPLVAHLVADGALGAKAGRGFYDWTAEGVAAARDTRDGIVRLLSATHNTQNSKGIACD